MTEVSAPAMQTVRGHAKPSGNDGTDGMDLPLPAIQRQIASGLDIIVHLGRLRDKTRKVLEVTEVLGYWEEEIHLQTLYCFEEAYKEAVNVTEDEEKEKSG